MLHRTTAGFWQAYQDLSPEVRRRAEKQFELLKSTPLHPSLQLKELGSRQRQEIWSVRVSLSFRALAIKRPDSYLWFWIGDHKTYDSLIS